MALSQEQFAAAQAHRESRPGQQQLFTATQHTGYWGPGEHNFDVLHAGEDARLTPRAPKGYYHQNHEQQLVFPGMSKSAPEHVRDLAAQHGLEGSLETVRQKGGRYHDMTLTDPKTNLPVGKFQWAGNKDFGQRMKPGEIAWVTTHQDRRDEGLASGMLSTAEKIGREHPGAYSSPRHSEHRSAAGRQWSRKKMKERGQEIW